MKISLARQPTRRQNCSQRDAALGALPYPRHGLHDAQLVLLLVLIHGHIVEQLLLLVVEVPTGNFRQKAMKALLIYKLRACIIEVRGQR